MPDVTAEFAAKLNDPTAWVINRAVPVFEPHEAHFSEVKDATGKVLRPARTVRVTETDLQEIVSEMQSSEAAGQYGAITAGHLDPLKGEANQAAVFGFHRNPRIMETGPDKKRRLVVDEYLYPDKAKERGQYPYRSADYFPSAKEIFGVAVLKRKPRLKLGTFAYETAERGECYQYAMPGMPGAMGNPAETFKDAQPNPDAAGGGAEAERLTPKVTDEEKKLGDKLWEYFVEEYGITMKGQPKETTNPESDSMATENKPAEKPVVDDKAASYAAEVLQYKAEVESLRKADAERKAELEGIRLEREQERCINYMHALEAEQYALTEEEKAKEIKKLLATPETERAERVKELRSIYAGRKVPSGKVELYRGEVEGGNVGSDPHKAPIYHEAALSYMRANIGCQYDKAVEAVKAAASKA